MLKAAKKATAKRFSMSDKIQGFMFGLRSPGRGDLSLGVVKHQGSTVDAVRFGAGDESDEGHGRDEGAMSDFRLRGNGVFFGGIYPLSLWC